MSDYFIHLTSDFNEADVRWRLKVLLELEPVRAKLRAAGIEIGQLSLLPPFEHGDGTLAQLWQRAQEHGEESEPDHEVGDLRELSRQCWLLLTREQRNLVAARLASSDDE
jgi:hypothetical protein